MDTSSAAVYVVNFTGDFDGWRFCVYCNSPEEAKAVSIKILTELIPMQWEKYMGEARKATAADNIKQTIWNIFSNEFNKPEEFNI